MADNGSIIMDQESSVASNCYYFLPQRPFPSPPQVSVAKVSERGLPTAGVAVRAPGACPGPARGRSRSRGRPGAAPGPLRPCLGPASALLAADPPHLVQPAASCLTATTSSTTCLLRGRVQNGASASQTILAAGCLSQPSPMFPSQVSFP